MASPHSPYRESFGYCALCGAQVPTVDLEPLVELDACPRCRVGDMAAAALRQSFDHKHFRHVSQGPTGSSPDRHTLTVEVTRPTDLEAFAIFTPEEETKGLLDRLLRKQDPQIGRPEFDRAVHIEIQSGFGPQVAAMLEHRGVRAGILPLVALGARIELGFRLVSASFESTEEPALPRVGAVEALLFPLAIHLEAHARTTVW